MFQDNATPLKKGEDKEHADNALQNTLRIRVKNEFQYYKFSEESISVLVAEVIKVYNRFRHIKSHLRAHGTIENIPDDDKLPAYLTFQEVRSKINPDMASAKRKRQSQNTSLVCG